MSAPSRSLLRLMAVAAALKARAATWEQVGLLLRRRPATCRRWRSRYKEVWDGLFWAADLQALDEAAAEAQAVLERQTRSPDERIRRGAEAALGRKRGKAAP